MAEARPIPAEAHPNLLKLTRPRHDFGISLRSDGKVVAGVGAPVSGQDVSIVSTSGGYDNGSWPHLVFTRTMSTGALLLYVDGAAAGSATGSTSSLTSPTNIDFGTHPDQQRILEWHPR